MKKIKRYEIRETIHSNYFYHICLDVKSICGDKTLTMHTNIPLSTWGLKTHLNEKYCKKCDEIYKNL